MLLALARFTWRDVGRWQVDPVSVALMAGALALYLWGASRVPGWRRGQVAAFAAGIAVVFLAVESVIGVYDSAYVSDHMIQHLMLIMVASPLFALARPLDLAAGASPALARLLASRPMEFVLHPLTAFALYAAFIPVAHLTGAFNYTLVNEPVHDLEHLGFLVVGYLFFRTAFGLEAGRRLHPGLRLVYVMAAVPVDTVTGLAMAMNSHNPYPNLASTAPAGSTPSSILSNVHLGGAIMWIGGDALMLLACIPIAVAWVKWETARTRELDAVLDAQGL
ncbi:MAG TPA: cytochrome c oxidase assembly protein [Acidimicrobiales bacterium]|nr:cytochrome c oxidase assembly protein [Acidimicrobiales bacterium]